jgi:hypothetical protein
MPIDFCGARWIAKKHAGRYTILAACVHAGARAIAFFLTLRNGGC